MSVTRAALIGLMAGLPLTASGASAASPAHPEDASHCVDGEKIYYHCAVEGTSKVASVCGPRRGPSGIRPGYLQYRFGPVGRPEFVFPASTRPAASRDVFRFEHQSTRDGSTQDYFLWFRNGQWIYEIYYREEFDNCSEAGCSPERTGQAAFVSAWRGPQAWSEGDESRGKRHRCTYPAASEPFKEIAEFASTLSAHDTKARIFAPLTDDNN